MPAEGLTFRRPTVDDLGRVAAIVAAEERALRGTDSFGEDEFRDWWRMYDLADGSWIGETEGGDSVAFAGLLARGGQFEYWVTVHPEHRGRGLSTELLRRGEERVRELEGTCLRAGMLAENGRARALLESLGYREVRRFYRMQIELGDDPVPEHGVDGIEIVPFRLDDAREFHAALNEAFAGDWGFVSLPFDEWKRFRLDDSETDTSLWFVAWHGDRVAGVVRCDAERFGGGFVGALGVRRDWRGRGIGMALLRRAFGEFQRRGAPHVSLGVDAQNESGATRLYERAGMRVVSEDVVFEKALA